MSDRNTIPTTTHTKLRVSMSSNRNDGWISCNHAHARWQRVIDLLCEPHRDSITLEQYHKLSKDDQGERKKAKGWIVGGKFRNDKRSSRNCVERGLITLDIDEMGLDLQHEILRGDIKARNIEWLAHTTRSHSHGKPRWRIIIPCEPSIPPDYFDAVSRIVTSWFSEDQQTIMDATDPVSFRVAQFMYRPTVSNDQRMRFELNHGDILDWRKVLKDFGDDWKDPLNLPNSTKRMKKHRAQLGATIKDPRTKEGLIGTFCRMWDIEAAIAEFIPDIYEEGDSTNEEIRYTYVNGSSTNGAAIYDDGQILYSNHSTDPLFETAVNAFDMVRIHLYGDLDEDADPKTKLSNLPSFHAMREMLLTDPDFEDFQEQWNEDRLALDENDPTMFDEVEEELDLDEDDLDLIGGDTPIKRKRLKKKDIIAEMNENHAIVMWGGDLVILTEYPDRKDHLPTYSNKGSFFDLYRPEKISLKNGPPMTKGEYWFDNPRRRTYKYGVKFLPGEQQEGVYNLWNGWKVEPKKGDCSLILKHIRHIMCRDNEEHYNAVIGFLAHIMQRPTERIRWGLVARGRKGVGKDTLGVIMREILGRYHVGINKPEHLTGNFNAHLAQSLFTHVEEGFWAGDKRNQGVLQSLVTNDEVLLERKGYDAAPMPNYGRILITSNELWVVPASDDERRWLVLDVSDAKMQNKKYFDALYRQLRQEGGAAAFFHFLLQVDLDNLPGFAVDKPPTTDALVQQKLESLHNVERWWFECLWNGELGASLDDAFDNDDEDGDSWDESAMEIDKDSIVSAYAQWHREQRYQGERANSVHLFRSLGLMVPDFIEKRGSRSKGRKRVWVIASLRDCRARFDEMMGGNAGWPSGPGSLSDTDDIIG